MKKALLLFIFVLCGCKSAPDDAIAAIFDHPDRNRSTHCLDIMCKDPTQAQIALIHRFNPNVFAASTCRRTENGYSTHNRRRAQMTVVVGMRRLVEIDVDDVSGFMFGSGSGTYTVEKISGFWTVTNYEQTWIS